LVLKNKKTALFFILIVSSGLFLAYYYLNKKSKTPLVNTTEKPSVVTTEMRNEKQSTECHQLKTKQPLLVDQLKNPSVDLRFENIHKKIQDKIYRLRSFYKDGDEGDIKTFLVYLEDQDENALIVEQSKYKKGTLFQRIEKSEGEILYTEQGLNLDKNFFHYINNRLVGIQNDETMLNCQFQQD
jgi:hypothetical protein